MPDWYRDHSASPECYSDSEYLEWAQDNGLYVDAAGNVDYGPPAPARDLCRRGLPHDWERDPDRRGEGLVCLRCGVTEAELRGGSGE